MDRRMQIYLTNRGEYFQNGVLMGTWVKLPIPEEGLESVLESIGVESQNYFITDYETLLPNLHISEYASIAELNELAERIEGLADPDYEKLGAILESETSMSITELLKVIDELDDFDLLDGINSDADIGEYFVDISCILADVPEQIKRYFDYDSYGRDIRLELNCCVTSFGLVIDNR